MATGYELEICAAQHVAWMKANDEMPRDICEAVFGQYPALGTQSRSGLWKWDDAHRAILGAYRMMARS